ncbi:hypothetical protein Tco_0788814 [Tanacetum coccineum]
MDINKMTDTLEPEETGLADCSCRGKIKSSSGRLRGSLLESFIFGFIFTLQSFLYDGIYREDVEKSSLADQDDVGSGMFFNVAKSVKSLKKNDLLDMLVPRMLSVLLLIPTYERCEE